MSPPVPLRTTAPLEVGIGCRDLAVMRGFYEDVLGLRFVGEAQAPEPVARRYAMARCAATVVRLQAPFGERIKLIAPERPAPVMAQHPEVVFDAANTMYLTFIVADIAALLARLRAGGGRPMSGDTPVQGRAGLQVAFLRDPEGNVLELVQYDDVAAYRSDLPDSQPQPGDTP